MMSHVFRLLKKKALIIALVISGCFAAIYVLLLFSQTIPRSLDIQDADSIEKDCFFYLDRIEKHTGGDIIYGAAKYSVLEYPYFNYVLGNGIGPYRNRALVLIDENNKAYSIRTYGLLFEPKQSDELAVYFENSGFIAYLPNSWKKQLDSYNLAIVYFDRNNHSYIQHIDKEKFGFD